LRGRSELDALRPGAVLVNTARWSLVDPDAVLPTLDAGRLAAYAIDSFAQEPPSPHALLRHPRVLATPHIGAYTAESAARAGDAAIQNVAAFLAEDAHARP